MKTYYENIIEEILIIIKDNLEILYKYDEDSLIDLRKYCYKNINKKYKPLNYSQLIYFTEEALSEIINVPYLYDFRTLE